MIASIPWLQYALNFFWIEDKWYWRRYFVLDSPKETDRKHKTLIAILRNSRETEYSCQHSDSVKSWTKHGSNSGGSIMFCSSSNRPYSFRDPQSISFSEHSYPVQWAQLSRSVGTAIPFSGHSYPVQWAQLSFHGNKATWHEVDHSPLSRSEVKID
jgi:hypothetical protein